MEVSKSQKSVERAEISSKTDMGCSKQGRLMVGQSSEYPVAISAAEGTSYIQPLPTSNGETAKGGHPLSSEHDGHQDRLECGTNPGRYVDMVILW